MVLRQGREGLLLGMDGRAPQARRHHRPGAPGSGRPLLARLSVCVAFIHLLPPLFVSCGGQTGEFNGDVMGTTTHDFLKYLVF